MGLIIYIKHFELACSNMQSYSASNSWYFQKWAPHTNLISYVPDGKTAPTFVCGVHHVNQEYIYLFLALAGRWFAWFGSLTWVGAHVGQTCDQLGGCFALFTDWTIEHAGSLTPENTQTLEMSHLTLMASWGWRIWVQKDLGVLTSIFYLQSIITF